MDSLSGKTAVVTGAASGMGRAFAERFGRAGMRVVLSDVEAPRLDEAVAAVQATGAEAIGVVADVSDEAAVVAVKDAALSTFGAVHVVCNNAGVGGGSETLADWEWVMNVNFWGVVHGMRTFLPLLREQGEGHIVNTASVAGIMPGFSPYSASKWAVVGISEGLYNQLNGEASPVGVTCLCPGWVATDIANSDRNRPEWATGRALEDTEPDDMTKLRMQWVADQLASGMKPDKVADMVHDAILDGTFWLFTDQSMIDMQRPRLEALLTAQNPPGVGLFPQE